MLTQPADMPRGLPNCGIVAASVFLNVPHNLVWNLYRLRFGMGPRWRGITHAYRRLEMVTACGVEIEEFRTLREYGKKCNVQTFARQYARPGVLYMVQVGRHVLCVRDGWAIDQHAACPVESHPSKRQIVATFTARKGQHGAAPRTLENTAMKWAAK